LEEVLAGGGAIGFRTPERFKDGKVQRTRGVLSGGERGEDKEDDGDSTEKQHLIRRKLLIDNKDIT
jgi:hypothetical protein